jgi:hypothetical protein
MSGRCAGRSEGRYFVGEVVPQGECDGLVRLVHDRHVPFRPIALQFSDISNSARFRRKHFDHANYADADADADFRVEALALVYDALSYWCMGP